LNNSYADVGIAQQGSIQVQSQLIDRRAQALLISAALAFFPNAAP
jgi:hypothetical protein